MLRTYPDVRKQWGGYFDHILVDEFQDINLAQLNIIRYLHETCKNVWVVGDDDQSIYGFRGASVSGFLDFPKDFPEAKIFTLDTCYRCAPQILSAASALIARNTKRHNKTLTSAVKRDGRVTITACDTDQVEAAVVATTIERLLNAKVPYREIAVLFRTSLVTSEVTAALRARGIPYVLRGLSEFWEHPAIRALTAALRYCADPLDAAAEAMLGSNKRSTAIKEKIPSIQHCNFINQVDELTKVIGLFSPPVEDVVKLWKAHLDEAKKKASQAGGLEQFLKLMDDECRRVPDDLDADVVVLSTIHSAKGLEWFMVIVVGCEVDIMPNKRASDSEEERRIAYVGITRAKRGLLVTHCLTRMGENHIKPSPYIEEMLGGLNDGETTFTRARMVAGVLEDTLQRWVKPGAKSWREQKPSGGSPPSNQAIHHGSGPAIREKDTPRRANPVGGGNGFVTRDDDPRLRALDPKLCPVPTLKGQRWTPLQDEVLSAFWKSGHDALAILREIPRTPRAIFARLELLGMVTPTQNPYQDLTRR